MMSALRFALLSLLLAAPVAAHAAACHDEADRLSARHQLEAAEGAQPQPAQAERARAKEHLDKARRADDDGIVEECLRQLAQARTLVEDEQRRGR